MKLKQISRKTVALVLSVLMILSTLSVGIISTNAAYISQQESGTDFASGEYIYLKNFNPSGWGSPWIQSSGYYWAHLWNSTSSASNDIKFSLYSGTANTAGAIYRAKITTAGTYDKVIFTRCNSSTSPWTDEWNRSGEISLTSGRNMFYGWDVNGTSMTQEYYAVKPASVTASVTNANSGTGTQSDPYLVTAGASFTVKLTATKDDPGMTGFGWNINSTSSKASSSTTSTYTKSYTASSTADTTTQYIGYAWCYKNSTSTYSSSYATSSTIYVKTVAANVDYYIAGSSGFVNGSAWTLKQTADKLTKNDDGTYSITYSGRAKGDHLFKLTDDTNWYDYYDLTSITGTGEGLTVTNADDGNGGNNIKITLASKSDVTIKYNPSANTITISATAITHNVTFSQPSNGTIKVNNSTTSPQTVAEGESYTVTLTPNTGYEVDTFTVGGTDKKSSLSNNTYTGTMGTSNVAIAATFKKTDYTLTKADTTNGSFTLSATTAQYGDTVTVNLTPNTGYKVSSVKYGSSNATKVSDTQYKFTMPAANTTVTVTFAPIDYAVTTSVSPTGSGSISVTKNSTSVTTYNIGDTLKFTATPNAGYEFVSITVKYSDNTTDTLTNGATKTISKTGGITVTANFKEKTKHNITTNYDSSMGSLGVDKSSTYEGDTVTITASPKSGYKLVSVSAKGADGTVLTVSGNKFTMPAQAVTVTATFEAYQNHNVTVKSGITGGSVSVSPTSAIYGTTITVTVTPDEGYTCTGVTAGSQTVTKSSDTTYTFKMPDSNVTVSATFEVSKARDIYVAGRFYANGSWLNGGTYNAEIADANFKFKRVGKSEIYRFDTGETIKTLSNIAYSNEYCYFRFYETTDSVNKQFGSSTTDYNLLLTGDDAGVQKELSINGKNLKFNDGSNTSTKTVVLYLDCTGTKAGEAPKFYFKLEDLFTVTMDQGAVPSSVTSGTRGQSGLDGDTSVTSVRHGYDDLTVEFDTQVTQTTDCNVSGYNYQVYGYSILITKKDGTKTVASVTDVSSMGKGKYSASYTFSKDVASAVVTPIYSRTEAYLEAVGRGPLHDVFLIMTPGSNKLNNTYEPNYYTWRSGSDDYNPEGQYGNGKEYTASDYYEYGGQKMLYIGNNTYMCKTESSLTGILFDARGNSKDTSVTKTCGYQTFDYDEFRKLLDLGYDNVTFEIKDGVSNGINKTIADNQATATCLGNSYSTSVITSSSMNDTVRNGQFELDTNIEGYYIDVFGDRLTDSSGNYIHKDDISGTTTSAKLTNLLKKIGATSGSELYGARYGWYSESGNGNSSTRNSQYNMDYCIRTYFMDFNETNINIAQMVSGYGQIEGGHGPLSTASQTNAAYMKAKGSTMYYYTGSSGKYAFSTGNEFLPTKYRGVPYLVSYMAQTSSRASTQDVDQQDGHSRVDGKWYYQAAKPQLTVKAKAGLMDADGNLVMNGTKIKEQGSTVGTGYVNGAAEAVVEQGDKCTLTATPAKGYTFVGFYSETGDSITSTPTVGSAATYFAVFQKIPSGSVSLTNTLYRFDNPANGGGNGSLGVKLVIEHSDGTTNTYTGTSSTSAQIIDGDKLTWIVTGKASGADEFIAFRQAEEQSDGTIYYSALDDPDKLSYDSSTNTWTYTSSQIVWDWTKQNQGTEDDKSASIDVYTDFRKVSVMATLEYKYKNRFDEWRTYTVKNVELSTEEIENGYIPSNETIAKHAPAIDEVFQSCTWNVSQAGKLETGKSYALLTAEQELKTFWYRIDNGGASIEGNRVPYNTMITLDAPDRDSEGKVFAYWRQYKCDESGNITGDPEIFSFEKYEQVRVTFNRYFEAVYSDEANPTFITNLQDAVYTREKYTDESGNTKDYIYTDFLMQFETSVKGLEMKDFVNGTGDAGKYATNVKFGIILERDMNYSGYTGSGDITAPTTDTDILKTTVTDYAKNLTSGGTANGWSSTTDKTKPQYNYYYHFFDYTDRADQLTDKGRIDGYFKYENTAENRAKVFNAYTYIIYHDVVADTDVVILSTPRVMNMYAIGIKDDGTTSST
ncbi:MAG: hypothetical protein ACI4G1_04265 [Ruminococcus sp.]